MAGQVNTGLDGYRNTILKLTRTSVPDHRCFVHFQPDTVPEPVAEVLAVPGLGDHVPGGRVHFAQSGPGPGRQAAGPLGRGHQLVEVPLPVRGVPQGHGPGHVRVVARELGAEVHGDEVAAA